MRTNQRNPPSAKARQRSRDIAGLGIPPQHSYAFLPRRQIRHNGTILKIRPAVLDSLALFAAPGCGLERPVYLYDGVFFAFYL